MSDSDRTYQEYLKTGCEKKIASLNMRISLTSAVLLGIQILSLLEQSTASAAVRPGPARVVLAPRNEEKDPMYIHSCAVKQSAETLEHLWVDLTRRIKDNKKLPGQLVRDMVDLACVQRNLYAYSDDDRSRTDLKIRFSNFMYRFLGDVVDNFKSGMQHLLDKLKAEEAAHLTHKFRAVPARDIMSVDPLLIADHPKVFRSERIRVQQAIREFVDVRVLIVERFVSACPLLLHIAEKIEQTNDVFKGALPKRIGVITLAPGTGVPRTTSRPTRTSGGG